MNAPSSTGRCKCGWQQPLSLSAWFVADTKNWEPTDDIEMTMTMTCPACTREIVSQPVKIKIHAKQQYDRREKSS